MCFRAYNDMLYLCEKYAPLESLERYRPEIKPSQIEHPTQCMRNNHLSHTVS
jgi:protein-ribulosamine 3-kinase